MYSNRILILLLGLSTLLCLGLVIVSQQPQTEETVIYYFVLVTVQGCLYMPSFCRVCMSEMSVETQNDERVTYYMFALLNGLECIFGTFVFYFVGSLIDQSIYL